MLDGKQNRDNRSEVSPIATVKNLSACLVVKNLEETAKWYQQTLGFEIVQDQDFPEYSCRVAFIEANGVRIELIQTGSFTPARRPDPPGHTETQGVSQLTFYVDDIDAVLERVKNRPITLVNGITTVDVLGIKAFLMRDNEGNLMEFIQRFGPEDKE